MEEIVRRLRKRPNLNSLKESLPVQGLLEDEEDNPLEDEEVDTPEVEDTHPESEETNAEEDAPEEELTPDDEHALDSEEEEGNLNPLDNPYAVNYKMGQEVSLVYSNGTRTKLKGTIDGYDPEGFYRIKWANGMTTNGITDIALADIIEENAQKQCLCGGTEFVEEDGILVCDTCGRSINEGKDPLALADKSRPKGKRLIRSEAHPISTAMKESSKSKSVEDVIRNAFKKSEKINEESSEETNYGRLESKLGGEFWTRLSELVDDIEELGYEVIDYNSEYVVVFFVDDEGDEGELKIPLGGTSRTMTLDFSRAKFYADMDVV